MAKPDYARRPAALIIPSKSAFFDTRVCGTSIMLRTACALGRVADTVHILKTPACPETMAQDFEAEVDGRETRPRVMWADSPEAIPADNGLFVVALPGVFDYRLCSAIREIVQDEGQIIRCRRPDQEDAPLWFVGKESARQLVQYLTGLPTASAPADPALQQRVLDFHPNAAVCEIISDERSRRVAEKKLVKGSSKDSDTFVAKWFDRKISGWLTRWVVRIPVTPNQLTIVSTTLGLSGAGLLLAGTYGTQLAGAALLVLSIIIDGCDGEVARLKFMESSFGRRLDFFLDNVVNALAIFATGAGYAFQHGEWFYLQASLINAAAAAAAVFPVYFLFFREENKAAVDRREQQPLDVYRLTENIAGRDYIYLVFFLALIGKVHWFALLCLGGLTTFLAIVLVLSGLRWLRKPRVSS